MWKASVSKKKKKNSENEEITILLNRFNKDEIITNIIETPAEKLNSAIAKKKKSLVIKQAINILTNKFSDLDELILFLHLRYIHTQKLEKAWNILAIENPKRFTNSNLISEKVSASVLRYFTKYNTECKVFSEKKANCMWIIMFLQNNRSKPICCAAHMKLSLIFVTNLKSEYSLLTEKVLRKTFRGSEIKYLNCFRGNADKIQSLNDKSWRTLQEKLEFRDEKKKTVENKEIKITNKSQCQIDSDIQVQLQDEIPIADLRTQSHDKRFEENEIDENIENVESPNVDPRTQSHSERFKENEFGECFENDEIPVEVPETQSCDKRFDENEIEEYFENLESPNVDPRTQSHSERFKENEFGECFENDEIPVEVPETQSCDERFDENEIEEYIENNEVPVVENLKYMVKANDLRKSSKDSIMSFCIIKFQGTNILKGLDKLVEYGIADTPLPDYLYQKPRTGQTEFTISKK